MLSWGLKPTWSLGVGDVPELPGVVGDAEVGGGAEGVGGHDAALDQVAEVSVA